VLRRGGQQEVTGVVVNDKPGVDRETLRRFRALLHQVEKSGPEHSEGTSTAPVTDLHLCLGGHVDEVVSFEN
jgi:hypothetical protein